MGVLVTGSSGFLGKIIAEELKIENKIFGLSRNFANFKVSLEKEVPVFDEIFEIVIHAAGKAHSVPKTEIQKKEFSNVNLQGTKNLLKGLENSKIPNKFIFISSVSVYGIETGNNVNENHPLLANDPYGLSKIEAEQIILNWCKENNVICTILRLPLLVGLNAPGNLGAMLKAIDKGYYFNIDNGKARKSMVLAKDVATFIPKVAVVGGIYNLTDGLHPSFHELSCAIANQKKKKLPMSLPLFIAKSMGYIGDLLGDKVPINSLKLSKITSDLTFDDSKARELLGWNPQSVIDYLKNNCI